MADGGAFLRLFIAFDVPEHHKHSIEKCIQKLRLAVPDAKWTPRESWHVTLKFFGEVPEDRIADLVRVAGKLADDHTMFSSRLTDVGCFPSLRRARVIWVGLDDPETDIAHLAKEMERAFGKRGFRKESRDPHPHITVGRLRTPRSVVTEIEESGPYHLYATPFEIKELVLYRSHLSPKGATYEAIETFPFEPEAS